MQIGVPREIKQDEYRVSMIPAGVEELTRAGHRVVIETGAGLGSGITDKHYTEAGAQIAASAAGVYGQADLIVKVKEPQAKEWPLLRSGQMVFTYFHFAASEDLTRNVLATGITAIAYETLRGRKGDLPCLTPMSEIAGRMSIQEGIVREPQGHVTSLDERSLVLPPVPDTLRCLVFRRHPRLHQQDRAPAAATGPAG